MISVLNMSETNIKVILNDNEPINVKRKIIPLIDVLKTQLEDEVDDEMASSGLIIPYPEVTLEMFNVILTALEEYLVDEGKSSDYPQPMPEDKTFGEVIEREWEKKLLTWINSRGEKVSERMEIAFKMTIFADYLGCKVIKTYFCVYIASWIKRNKFDAIIEMGETTGRLVK